MRLTDLSQNHPIALLIFNPKPHLCQCSYYFLQILYLLVFYVDSNIKFFEKKFSQPLAHLFLPRTLSYLPPEEVSLKLLIVWWFFFVISKTNILLSLKGNSKRCSRGFPRKLLLEYPIPHSHWQKWWFLKHSSLNSLLNQEKTFYILFLDSFNCFNCLSSLQKHRVQLEEIVFSFSQANNHNYHQKRLGIVIVELLNLLRLLGLVW